MLTAAYLLKSGPWGDATAPNTIHGFFETLMDGMGQVGVPQLGSTISGAPSAEG
jgi:hypothetical protein